MKTRKRKPKVSVGLTVEKDVADASKSIQKWLAEQGAVESIKYDEDTGRPYRAFTVDLTKDD